MKPAHYTKHSVDPATGYTKWIQPVMASYLVACCDCGLIHEFQFRIVGVRKQKVQFRARRKEMRTRAERKKRGIVVRHD